MKKRIEFIARVLICFVAARSFGQTNFFEMPGTGESLPVKKFELVNKLSKSHLADLPKTLETFRYSGRLREFSTNGLQELLDRSVFKGTNIADLVSTNRPIRLMTSNRLDLFFADASTSGIEIYNHGDGIDLRRKIPPYDAVPDFDIIKAQLLHYAQIFGIDANEMSRKDDGAISFRRSDGKKVMRGGAIKFISERSVQISRSVAGYVFLDNDEKIELKLGVDGWLKKFEMKWRPMESIRTNRVFAINEMLDHIKNGRVLADVMNEYPSDGVAQIILKDVEIQYYVPTTRQFRSVSTNADIFPIATFYAVFKSKSGKTKEGGLFTPACP